MQKIYVKNFRAISEAEIEIKKILILIGPQASGKSTIATLIYFFRGLGDNILRQVLRDKNVLSVGFTDIISARFNELFGLQDVNSDFLITFYYDVDQNKHLTLAKLRGEIKLRILFDASFLDEQFKLCTEKLQKAIIERPTNFHARLSEKNEEYIDNSFDFYEFKDELKRIFFDKFNSRRYIIAGRGASIGFGNLFESFFRSQLELKMLENRNTINPQERLMIEYLNGVAYLKDRFQDFSTFENIVNQSNDKYLHFALGKFEEIFKDKYQLNSNGEYIELSTGKQIPFFYASSGQQESIRILQDIFDVMAFNETIFRVVEEPEAHLFPEAQKKLVELFALLSNHQAENQLIITTHSPYVLTAFNNLLFANRIISKNYDLKNEVDKVIPQAFQLKSEKFSAYSFGDISDETYCRSILETETTLINQNYLDSVSESLAGEFQELYRIHAKSFVRK